MNKSLRKKLLSDPEFARAFFAIAPNVEHIEVDVYGNGANFFETMKRARAARQTRAPWNVRVVINGLEHLAQATEGVEARWDNWVW